jgi:2-oxoglutarate dehydrogenase E1 component
VRRALGCEIVVDAPRAEHQSRDRISLLRCHRIVDLYPAIEEVIWAQEEPKNQGAWTYVSPRLRMSTGNALPTRYIGRPDRASPAEGYAEVHKKEQERIVNEVNAPAQQASGAKRRGMALKS